MKSFNDFNDLKNAGIVSNLTFIKSLRNCFKIKEIRWTFYAFFNIADGLHLQQDLCNKHVFSILMNVTLHSTFILRLPDYDIIMIPMILKSCITFNVFSDGKVIKKKFLIFNFQAHIFLLQHKVRRRRKKHTQRIYPFIIRYYILWIVK